MTANPSVLFWEKYARHRDQVIQTMFKKKKKKKKTVKKKPQQ